MDKFILVFLCLSALSACASGPKSEAMRIAEAADIDKGIKDLPAGEVEKHIPTKGKTSIPAAGLAAGYATGNFTAPRGFSSGGATAMALIGMGANPTDPGRIQQLVAWMPKKMAASDDAAREKMAAYFVEAIEASLPEGYRLQRITEKQARAEGERGFGGYLLVSGGNCSEYKCQIYAQMFSGFGTPTSETAPEFLGSYDSFAWVYTLRGARGSFKFKVPEGKPYPFNMHEFYLTMSAKLPAWAYVYLPATQQISEIPILYNQGQPNYFIKPETASK